MNFFSVVIQQAADSTTAREASDPSCQRKMKWIVWRNVIMKSSLSDCFQRIAYRFGSVNSSVQFTAAAALCEKAPMKTQRELSATNTVERYRATPCPYNAHS